MAQGKSAQVRTPPQQYTRSLQFASPSADENLSRFYFLEERHNKLDTDKDDGQLERWRMKERLKTMSVALVYCLNIGVDPPDVIKTSPCARMECWIDPFQLPAPKALDTIGKTLQAQYERWQTRTKYKLCLDPTVDEVKKLCVSLRRHAKDEHVLFHYNGHGVPRPTANGEIWVFNKNFTQYIPLSIFDLQNWMGAPSLFVFDCSAAGLIVNSFLQFADQREREYERTVGRGPAMRRRGKTLRDCILLAACGAGELLPQNPALPADVFTACLTTPIKMALRWFCANNVLCEVHPDMVDKIPGRLTDRRTPLGELNWIFTAITDTIAWDVLPRPVFQRLFRQDLLVASLFRNFLLAERIMRSAGCTPISVPKLPATYNHSLWQSWDLAADICLSQLPAMIADPEAEFNCSPFFAEQLTAFEVWLDIGAHKRNSPEQLPIVLQVLLSQTHRLRALELLSRFLDLGQWAVNLALCVGIFPYVLKLLQSPAAELRPMLVFIWAKLLAVDRSCQRDLVKDGGHVYFVNALSLAGAPVLQRTMAAFVLACLCDGFRQGQTACHGAGTLATCAQQLQQASDPLLRRWLCLCIGKLWRHFDDAKRDGMRDAVHERLCGLTTDPVAEVRAAATYALGTLFGGGERSENQMSIEHGVAYTFFQVTADGASVVRRELVVALARFVETFQPQLTDAAAWLMEEERLARERQEEEKRERATQKAHAKGEESPNLGSKAANRSGRSDEMANSIFTTIWKMLVGLAMDPFKEVADAARRVLDDTAELALMPLDQRAAALEERVVERREALHRERQREKDHDAERPEGAERGESDDEAGPAPLVTEDPHSVFFEWACRGFRRPQHLDTPRPPDSKESEKRWRAERNDRMRRRANAAKESAGTRKLEDQKQLLDNDKRLPLHLAFDPFEPYLIVSDDQDGISIYNWETGARSVVFQNGSMQGARITGVNLLNDSGHSLLAVSTDEGVVRVWRDLYEFGDGQPRLLTAWRAVAEVIPGRKGSGLVMDWQQRNGFLMCSGDVGVVRVWDLERELRVLDVPTGAETCVTSLSSDVRDGTLLMAGCGDGSVRLFDLRLPARESLVRSFAEHKNWVVGVCMQSADPRELVSGSDAGDVLFWDVRQTQSVKSLEAHKGGMSAFALHSTAPVFATGSTAQNVRVHNTGGTRLSSISYYEGFLRQRIGPVCSLTFHPYDLYLAVGGTDGMVAVYAGENYK